MEAMALLEALLKKREAKFQADATPIQFDFGTETWNFDPQRTGTHCERRPNSAAVLTVHCTPATLGRVLLQPAPYLLPGEELKLVGDASALTALIQALGP